MDILLTDEEIENTFKNKVIFASNPKLRRQAEANLIAEAQLKKVVEYLDSPNKCNHGFTCRVCCPQCWQALKEIADVK